VRDTYPLPRIDELLDSVGNARLFTTMDADWDVYLEPALLAIRTMPNEFTGHTAANLLYGYDISTPAIWPRPPEDYVEGEYEDALLGRLQVIDGVMREFWGK
jgi:hypothetical protein